MNIRNESLAALAKCRFGLILALKHVTGEVGEVFDVHLVESVVLRFFMSAVSMAYVLA
ncbi:hypothetical protein ACK1U3_17550 [Pseudomonas promysalinigenes]|uniref:hypothetical protein n=1 Tax=Pseudomonas promysalinigenes TaxID=485898 RepID=UPI00391754BA